MLKLGNLIPYSPYSDYTHFNVYDSLEEVDNNLPTLILGWENVKKYYNIDDIDPLERHFDGDVFWTFELTEDRKFHEKDKVHFIEHCYSKLVEGIEYNAVDPVQTKFSIIRDLYTKLSANGSVITYKYFDTVYLFIENKIFGFDIEMYDKLGLRTKLAKRIKYFTDIFIDEEKENKYKEYREHLKYLNNELKYIPYLYLKNEYE